ncbi:MAG TPA: PHP domain-containing protein [Tepidimicrobium sp.]|nr:PHP domain-containing protein [Tepidimicrobium sp.]
MRLIGDYHTHTIFSHGKGSIRDNVEAARKKGLKQIAICDHGPGHRLYGVKRDALFHMRGIVDGLNKEYGDIEVLLGVEANVMSYDGSIDVDDDILGIIDILLLGFHYGIIPKGWDSRFKFYILNPLSKLLPPLQKNMIAWNTGAIIRAMDRYPIDIITHPGSKARLDIGRLARAAYDRGVALEINSSHSQLSVENIEIALNEKVEFYINSDAHHPSRVGDVATGIERALKAKIPIDRIVNVEKE